MKCRNCPYGEEDFKRRMYWYEKTVKEQGIPNEIYKYLSPKDAPDEFEQFLWCDKVGGKVYWAGRCSDSYSQSEISQNRSKQKRRNKRERDHKYKNHLKFLAEYPAGYSSPVIYRDEIFIRGQEYVENPKPYYKRYYREQRAKYIKRMSNKAIRRYKGDIPKKGNWCHKLYDFGGKCIKRGEESMSNSCNGVASEYEMQKVSKTYESHNKLPQTSCNIPMPKTEKVGEKICENCDKEDMCMYKEECMKAVKDILNIEDRTNVFIETHIDCKKWSKKPVYTGIR